MGVMRQQAERPADFDYSVVNRACPKCRQPVDETYWCPDCELTILLLRGFALVFVSVLVAWAVMLWCDQVRDPLKDFYAACTLMGGVGTSIGFTLFAVYRNRSRKRLQASIHELPGSQ